jgi:hypothetical protein
LTDILPGKGFLQISVSQNEWKEKEKYTVEKEGNSTLGLAFVSKTGAVN